MWNALEIRVVSLDPPNLILTTLTRLLATQKAGDIGRAKCCSLNCHALLSSIHASRTIIFPSISSVVERIAEGVNIVLYCARPSQGCRGYTMVAEIVWGGHPIPRIFLLHAIMWRDFQPGLLETLNPCTSLCGTELLAVRRDQQSPGCFIPSILSDENSHHRRVLRRSTSQKVNLCKMASTIIPRYWRRHRANTNGHRKARRPTRATSRQRTRVRTNAHPRHEPSDRLCRGHRSLFHFRSSGGLL